ncbi:MAG TPA: ATP-binding protein [Myxococcota bacterium]|nr:ATP-binding protein [Myxococcota bacterium]
MTPLWRRFTSEDGGGEFPDLQRSLARGLGIVVLLYSGFLLPLSFVLALHWGMSLASAAALQIAGQAAVLGCLAVCRTDTGRCRAEELLFALLAVGGTVLILGDAGPAHGALRWVALLSPVGAACCAPWRAPFALALGFALAAVEAWATGFAPAGVVTSLAAGVAGAAAALVQRRTFSAFTTARTAADAARNAAMAADRAKSQFLANMSHEIRTPLTAILGFTDELIDEAQRTGHALGPDPALLTVKRNGHHLLAIVNDILDLARIEAGKLTIETQPCPPLRVVGDVVALLRPRAVDKQLRLDVRLRGPVPETIQTDATRLHQVLVNLVGNAIKFTEHGGVTLRLEHLAAGPERAQSQLAIDVIDTGIGLGAEDHARIFEAFAQGDASLTRRHGGTGLGLTISRALARVLGGDITVESASAGSVFRATVATGALDGVRMIDALQQDSLRPTTPATARPAFREQRPLTGRVLLAEDGPDNQALISSVLRRAGLDVDLANDGEIACEKTYAARDAGEPYALIVMDMQMPMMTGYEATAALRREGLTTPILALTAQAMTGDRDKCLAAGCDEYLSKPIDRGRLLQLVRELLEKAGQEPGA